MTGLEELTRNYRVAFLLYLPRREESALTRGYELGRAAVTDGLSILELARVHHEVFLEVLRETPPAELPEVATAASEFLLEVLATFDMAQRSFLDQRYVGSPTAMGPPAGERVQGSATGGSDGAARGTAPGLASRP